MNSVRIDIAENGWVVRYLDDSLETPAERFVAFEVDVGDFDSEDVSRFKELKAFQRLSYWLKDFLGGPTYSGHARYNLLSHIVDRDGVIRDSLNGMVFEKVVPIKDEEEEQV